MSQDTLETLRTLLSARYRVEHLLGSGGMAMVYLAHDLKHDRPVAIKVLRPELAVALGPERFLREIQIAAKLNHPHILALHDSGDAGGLLYYVMPYVAGESLQEKLVREKQLSVDEALRITREVCAALAYAHGQGVIHRDIKPANILLSAGYALVADFGLARAISRASSSASITQPWLAVGTPNYMSPEQVSGEEELDGRSDIYSLGCVLYELLAGNPPFATSNPGSTLLRQRSVPPAPIRSVRASVPGFVEGAISRSLAKAPAERFQTAEEFAGALGSTTVPITNYRRTLIGAGAIVVLGAIAILLLRKPPEPPPRLDASRLVVFPFAAPESTAADAIETALREGFSRWIGLTLVERPRIEAIRKERGNHPLDEVEARQVAIRASAGRFVRGELTPSGDSMQVRATLYDGVTGEPLSQQVTRLSRAPRLDDVTAANFADALLFQGRLARIAVDGPLTSHSFRAVEVYLSGRQAIEGWDLPEADTAFARALDLDAGFIQASLWLAQVRAWQGLPARVWRLQVDQALANKERLGARDMALASALSTLGRRDYASACEQWRAMTQKWSSEFTVWYGYAICQVLDDGVRLDHSSPSGWGFRSSYHQAQLAWRRAFDLRPAIYRDVRASGLRPGMRILWTSTNRVRAGEALPPDTGTFSAFPSWGGDTLEFIPYRDREFFSGKAIVAATSTPEAVRQQRRAFYDLASAWRSTSPRNPDAGEALALGLWLLGNATAADTIHSVRKLATKDEDRLRLGITEALMLLQQGAPEEGPLRRARSLIDSLLAAFTGFSRVDPWDMSAISSLTGRAFDAARLIRLPSPRTIWNLPPGLASDALALLAFASLGGPAESLAVLEHRVKEGIVTGVDPTQRSAASLEWLGRPGAVAFRESPLPSLSDLAGQGDYLIEAILAYRRGDTSAVHRQLQEATTGRAWMQPWDLSFEALQPEATLLAAVGDDRGAIERLDPTLATLRGATPDVFRHPVGAGMLVRAMVLRADLAAATGDAVTAARWARAVTVLWSNADPFLQSTVRRMRQLARAGRA